MLPEKFLDDIQEGGKLTENDHFIRGIRHSDSFQKFQQPGE
jgi:hypothetical protein